MISIRFKSISYSKAITHLQALLKQKVWKYWKRANKLKDTEKKLIFFQNYSTCENRTEKSKKLKLLEIQRPLRFDSFL